MFLPDSADEAAPDRSFLEASGKGGRAPGLARGNVPLRGGEGERGREGGKRNGVKWEPCARSGGSSGDRREGEEANHCANRRSFGVRDVRSPAGLSVESFRERRKCCRHGPDLDTWMGEGCSPVRRTRGT
ncbi:hypothetical protein MTO96_022457 [Rhipicephalus appendiculatus]